MGCNARPGASSKHAAFHKAAGSVALLSHRELTLPARQCKNQSWSTRCAFHKHVSFLPGAEAPWRAPDFSPGRAE